MSVLNQTVVDATAKQLKQIRIAYIFAIVTMSLLLVPLLNILLGGIFFITVTFGILIFIKREIIKHYRDSLVTIALYLIGFGFVSNIIQIKILTYASQMNMNDSAFLIAFLIGLFIYALVLTTLILISISASRFFEQRRQFNMMVTYQNVTAYGPKPFKLSAVSIEPSTVYEKRSDTRGQFISFAIRALCVIALYFVIMNVDLVTYIVLTPAIMILRAVRSSVPLDDQQFGLLAQVWFNFYLQALFVITFVLIFLKEIRLGLSRLFKPQKFAFIFCGYGMSLLVVMMTIFLLKLCHIDLPSSSKNQELIEQMQKVLPIVSTIGTVLLAPITEELVFRQGIAEFLYRLFDSFTKTPKKIVQDIAVVTAVLVSGTLFGFIHVMSHGDYISMIPYVVSGLVYTVIYFWSGRNVSVAIGVHMLNNLIATFLVL